jgi:hypothetical protein
VSTLTLVGSLLAAAFALAVGGSLARRAYETWRRSRAVASTEPTPAGEVTPGDGRTAVTGVARPVDGATVEAPFTGTEALVADAEVARLNDDDEYDSRPAVETLYEETSAVPFVVADDSGEVRVEVPVEGRGSGSENAAGAPAADVDLRLDVDRVEVQPGSEPAHLASFVRESAPYDLHVTPGGRRRYDEGVLEPGEEAYVLGVPTRGGDSRPTLAGGDDPLLVSDLARDEVARGSLWGVLFTLLVALPLLGFGLLAAAAFVLQLVG